MPQFWEIGALELGSGGHPRNLKNYMRTNIGPSLNFELNLKKIQKRA
jgi:hypothetical protein